MKKNALTTLAVLSMLVTPVILQLHAAPVTITGIVSDTMCGGGKHMAQGKSAAQCTQECVRAGSSYALVVGGKVYTLTGKSQTIAPFAGKQVQVAGDVKGSTIAVTSITAMQEKMPM